MQIRPFFSALLPLGIFVATSLYTTSGHAQSLPAATDADDWTAEATSMPAKEQGDLAATEEAAGTASAKAVPAENSDPFFEGDLEAAFADVDTEWQDDQEISKEAKKFVGPPSPSATFKKLFKHDVLSLLLKSRLIGSVQEFQDTRDDGFELLQLRAVVSGALGDFRYMAQVDAARTPGLIDATLSYQPLDAFGITLGRMKTPFSGEFLQTRPALSFVDRSEIVLATAPGRATGIKLGGSFLDKRFRYWVGGFNGSAMTELDWGRNLLGVVRVEGTPVKFAVFKHKISLDLATNVAYGDNECLQFNPVGPMRGIAQLCGSRALAGGDLKLRLGPVWLAGEGIFARYDGTYGVTHYALDTMGGYGEIGAELIANSVEVMVRYDGLYTDHINTFNHFVIGGFRVKPTDFFWMQINYTWGLDDTGARPLGQYWSRNQLLTSFQLAL